MLGADVTYEFEDLPRVVCRCVCSALSWCITTSAVLCVWQVATLVALTGPASTVVLAYDPSAATPMFLELVAPWFDVDQVSAKEIDALPAPLNADQTSPDEPGLVILRLTRRAKK